MKDAILAPCSLKADELNVTKVNQVRDPLVVNTKKADKT